MKARSGMTMQGRLFEVELETSDLYGFYDDETVGDWNGTVIFRRLSMHADQMVVEYMARESLIPKEFAAQRMREIKETWLGTEPG